jgi:hypothetical protein
MSMLISQIDIDIVGVLVLARKPAKLLILLCNAMVKAFEMKTGVQPLQDESFDQVLRHPFPNPSHFAIHDDPPTRGNPHPHQKQPHTADTLTDRHSRRYPHTHRHTNNPEMQRHRHTNIDKKTDRQRVNQARACQLSMRANRQASKCALTQTTIQTNR